MRWSHAEEAISQAVLFKVVKYRSVLFEVFPDVRDFEEMSCKDLKRVNPLMFFEAD